MDKVFKKFNVSKECVLNRGISGCVQFMFEEFKQDAETLLSTTVPGSYEIEIRKVKDEV